ncbi:O-methyltransferase [Fulvivirga sediminis]|uniref:Class I SAM-dependent methyltransferase n=1 Tax=Fulvivirga sediminis TaxID=2803949 RepID=A0A937FAX1_9BACT|nr:class I SAM-dependent methyltransferase [Fulvivirga sediminis]MBL3657510.1 class I SAM-dependent methyltransferase [Fulvivirga sediminis]
MIKRRIYKHKLIFKRRIKQKSEIDKILYFKNDMLMSLLKAFQLTKSNTHTKEDLAAFESVENYRKKLLDDPTEVTYEVFSLDKKELVQNICMKAVSTKKWCQFLYYLVKSVDNANVLEIGTNLGVSGSYILEAMKPGNGKFISMEGLPKLCEISSKRFSEIVSPSRFEILQGLYDHTFPQLISNGEKFDILFIDGNHKKEPTLEYFRKLKSSSIGNKALFVFDDIYWSEGMKEAWQIIRNDEDVNFSIDLYEQGVVIIDKNETSKGEKFDLHLAY